LADLSASNLANPTSHSVASNTREGFEVVGVVRQLDKGPNEEVGTVTVVTVIDDELSTVHVRLRGEQYSAAVQAHGAGRQVRLIGDLQRRSGRAHEYDLLNASTINAAS